MKRIHIRRLALALAVGVVTLVPIAGASATSGATTPQEVQFGRGYANVSVLPALLPNSKENTNVVAQNDGNAPATIVLDIYTPGGVLIPTASVPYTNVPVGGTRVFPQAINSGLTPGFRGVGVVSSDQPINALLVRGIDSANGMASSSIHNAYAAGATSVSLPFVVNALDGAFNSRVAIANTGAAAACVTIEYAFRAGAGSTPAGGKANYTDPGNGSCAGGYSIPLGGQISFAPSAIDGAIPFPGATANAQMAAKITSTQPVTVAVDAWVAGKYSLGSYDGFTADDLGTNIIVPLAIKHQDGFLSQFLISNPNASAASVTIDYKSGTGTTYTKTLTVAANGSADHGVYSDSTVPVGFVGSATITSTVPVGVVAFYGKMTTANSYVGEDVYAAINGVPTTKAKLKAKFPLVFRRAYSSGGLSGYNSWVSVTVADGTTANVTVTAVNDSTSSAPGCGTSYTSTVTKSVTGSFIFYQNADSDNGFQSNPSCFWGGMVISSDKPIVAIGDVANDLVPGDTDGRYNAFASN